MPNGIPGLGREDTVSRFLREERQRQALLDDILGPSRILQSLYPSSIAATAQSELASLQATQARLSAALEMQRLADRYRTPAWASSITETMRTMAVRDQSLLKTEKLLTDEVVKTLAQANEAFLKSATASGTLLANEALADTVRSLGKIASSAQARIEDAWRFDVTTARLSAETDEQIDPSVLIELSDISESVSNFGLSGGLPSTFAGFADLVDKVLAVVDKLNKNTKDEIGRAGLLTYLALVLTLIGAAPVLLGDGGHAQKDEAAHHELIEKVDELNRQVTVLQQSQAEREKAFLDGLPRASLRRVARVRLTPVRSSAIAAVLEANTPVACKETHGKWKKIVFRDELSGQLASGWVWASSLAHE